MWCRRGASAVAWSGSIAAAVALIAALASAHAAYAAPLWMNAYPFGLVHVQPSVVTVDVFNTAKLNVNTAQITIGGVRQKTYVTNVGPATGHWSATETQDPVTGVWKVTWTWVPDTGGATKATIYCYPSTLSDGTRLVSVSVKDVNGASLSYSWSFTIGIPPTIGAPAPAAGSTLSTASPTVSVSVSDNTAVTRWDARFDGVPASATLSGGKLSIVPGAPLANDTTTTLSLLVYDSADTSASRSWQYYVQTYPPMPGDYADCLSCHPDVLQSNDMNANCALCHTATSGYAAHTGAAVQLHTRAALDPACGGCHVSALLSEHGRYPGLTCASCHRSADVRVVAAIQAGVSSCNACHDVSNASHYESVDHTATPAPEDIRISGVDFGSHQCSECHSLSLGDLHPAMDGSPECARCHPEPRGTFGAWDHGCVQGGCHSSTSSAPMHAGIDGAHAYPAEQAACLASGCHDAGAITPFAGRSLADLHSLATTVVAGETRASCGICHGVGRSATNDCLASGCHPERALPHGYDPLMHTGSPAAQESSIDGTTYPAIPCAGCHSLELGVEHAKPTSAGNTGCSECHPTLVATLSGGWDRSTCAQGGCHAATSAAPMHASIDTAHQRLSANASCVAAGCHKDGSLAAIHSNATTTVAGGTETSCMVCHGGGIPASADCTVCHPDKVGSHYDPSLHTATTGSADFTILGTDFGAVACGDCHPSTDLAANHAGGCSTCHPAAAAATKPWSGACDATGCHAAGSAQPMHAGIDTAHTVGTTSCVADGCHAGGTNAAEIHRSATTTSQPALSSCDICHAPGQDTTTDCTHCHDTAHPHAAVAPVHQATVSTGDIVFFDAGAVHSVELLPGGVSTSVTCSMCHGEMNLMALHSDNCPVCHTGFPPPAQTVGTWSGGCSQGSCHPTYHGGASAGHDGVYIAEDCGSCHWIVPYSTASPIQATTDWCGGCHTLVGDPTPPRTACNASSGGTYLGSQTFRLTATDYYGSGVAATYWQLDEAAWATGTVVPVSAPATGTVPHTLRWYSTDNAGNVEATHSITIEVAPGITSGVTLTAIGGARFLVVPAGVTTLTVDLYGGMGGGSASYGARLRANVRVTPGQVLALKVGSRANGASGGWGGGGGGNGVGGATGGGGSTSVGILGGAVLAEAGGGGGSAGTSSGGPAGSYSTSSYGGNRLGQTSASGVAAGGGGGWTGGAYGATANSPGGGGTSHVAGNVYLTFSASGNTAGDGRMIVSW